MTFDAAFATRAKHALFDQHHVETDFVVELARVDVCCGAVEDEDGVGAVGASAHQLSVLSVLNLHLLECYKNELKEGWCRVQTL